MFYAPLFAAIIVLIIAIFEIITHLDVTPAEKEGWRLMIFVLIGTVGVFILELFQARKKRADEMSDTASRSDKRIESCKCALTTDVHKRVDNSIRLDQFSTFLEILK